MSSGCIERRAANGVRSISMTRPPGGKIGSGETEYGSEDVDKMRVGLITLRDAALDAAMMEWAVSLSHTIAFLAVAREEIWGREERPADGKG